MTRHRTLLLSFFATLLAPGRAWNHIPASELSQIVDSSSPNPVLVAFVKPEEPASAALEPEWVSATSSAGETQKAFIRSVDCSEDGSEAACQVQKEMPAYPSIWLLGKDKEVARYKGAKRADAFLHFLSRKSRPLITEIKTEDQLNLFKTADETVFVAYLDPSDTDSRGAFERVAQQYSDEFSFGIVSDQELAQTQQNVKVPAVVGYKVIDGDVVVRKGEVGNVDEFEGWIKETSRGVIGELTLLNQQRLIDRAWPIVYLFAPTEKERQKLRKTLYKFARSYYDSLTAVTVDPHEFPDLMGKLGLDPDCASPAGAVHQLSKDRIYPYPKGQPLTPGAIQNWGMDIYNGRVKPWTPPGSAKTAEGEKEEDDNNNNHNNGFIKFTNKKNKVAAGTKRKVVSMANIPGVKIKIAGRDEL